MLGESYTDYTTYSKQEILKSLKRAEEVVENIVGEDIKIFRPPQSKFNRTLLNAVFELGYTIKFWDTDIRRWSHYDIGSVVKKLKPLLYSGRIVNLGVWDNFAKSVLESTQ
jgi:peptidoglycan/xylan/chitin deacetylase (PgdA/CDA1 family)